MITNGAAEGDLWRTILDALGLSGAPRESSKIYRKFSEISDDVLARSLIFPQDVDPNPAVARGTQPTAPPMRRDGLPKLSDLDDDALAACLRNPTMLVD
jgi:hypothetical protein